MMQMSEQIKLPVPSPSGPPVEIDPPSFPAPVDDVDCTPPIDESTPPVDLSTTPSLGTAGLEEQETISPKTGRGVVFTAGQVQMALQLREKGLTHAEIGKRIGRSTEGVRRVLLEWMPTLDLSKAILQRDAHVFADRVVKDADVDQSLEVLDRLQVLTKRDKGVDNRVQVIVGINLEDMVAAPTVAALEGEEV